MDNGWFPRMTDEMTDLFSRPGIRLTLLVASLLWILGAPPTLAQSEFTFKLIPEDSWHDAQPDRSTLLPKGDVFLYREGSYRPDLVAPVNVAQPVSPGIWLWIAEGYSADGAPYVSVETGRIRYPEGADRFDRGVIGPVAPACILDLGSSESWRGVERLDAVSPDRGSVFPVVIGDRSRFMVPAGNYLVYAVGPLGVTAITDLESCTAGEIVGVAPLAPPAADRQGVMVSVRLPGSETDLSEDLNASLLPFDEASPLPPQSPATALRNSVRTTFFFPEANANTPLVLEILHPAFFPYRQEISPRPGEVLELPDVELEPRS